ncbi:hypothetical protein CROQUDRAFT_102538 [Cronartium quercuum f. sp. fusiforme G11]|uniref:Uncharacterized protein n=1 Tax=Cronartium quercuum f. sp. fusiforme G11 TaxID=708437 RepID=A0A9P6N4R4_9BASI|nr:hypothetical protein CROQUDRAFT_102538 [Cronartium quercuum f. sp. fusiforme G11]
MPMGHTGLPVRMDKAAKLVAKANDKKTTLPMGLSNLLQVTWQLLSVSSSDFPNQVFAYKTAAKKVADAYNDLEKGHAVVVFQL